MNADLGEGDPYDAELLRIVSSCNIACGGHAGDKDSMLTTVKAAIHNGVAIGAHPSYADREGFGRQSGYQSGTQLLDSLTRQLRALGDVVADCGARIHHVKPHGALYNDAAADADLAEIVAKSVVAAGDGASLVGPPASELQRAAERHLLGYLAEAFIDRAYLGNGRLVPRTEPGAVHDSLDKIKAQAISLAVNQSVTSIDGRQVAIPADTLCVHGDTPGAADAARAVRSALRRQGIEIGVVDD
jgi:UPF0271 protein